MRALLFKEKKVRMASTYAVGARHLQSPLSSLLSLSHQSYIIARRGDQGDSAGEPDPPPVQVTGGVDLGEAVCNRHVLALDIAGILQALAKSAQAVRELAMKEIRFRSTACHPSQPTSLVFFRTSPAWDWRNSEKRDQYRIGNTKPSRLGRDREGRLTICDANSYVFISACRGERAARASRFEALSPRFAEIICPALTQGAA